MTALMLSLATFIAHRMLADLCREAEFLQPNIAGAINAPVRQCCGV